MSKSLIYKMTLTISEEEYDSLWCEQNSLSHNYLGYFSKVFKRQFGMTPSWCLTGRKANN